MSAIHVLWSNGFTEIGKEVGNRIMQSSNYWKPDMQSSEWLNKNSIFLGKSHLFNIPGSESDIVFTDETRRLSITAHARIDNREDLLNKLSIVDENLSNSELILRAYDYWKNECVKFIYGDFAFVIVDQKNEKLFAARDHIGIKSLFYNVQDKGILVSNEPKAFVESSWFQPKLSESWLVRQLWGVRKNAIDISLEGLELLPPAHYLEYDKENGLSIHRYWELKDDDSISAMNKADILEKFKFLFNESVKNRLVSNYPLSCQLSEGIDSNGIAGFASKLIKSDQTIYTYSYGTLELNNETRERWSNTYKEILEMLEMHTNLEGVWTKEQAPEKLEQDLIENTSGITLIRPQYITHCWLAEKNNSRVMLSGWGGDHCVSNPGDFYESELFSKGKFLATYKFLKLKESRGRINKPLMKLFKLFYKHYFTSSFATRRLTRPGVESSLMFNHHNAVVKEEYLKKNNLGKEVVEFAKNYQKRFSPKDYMKRELVDIGVERRVLESELTGRMFRLEYRFPMLDVRLLEFAYNMPSYLSVYNGVERYAYREIIKGVTTERIRLRRKVDVNHPARDNKLEAHEFEQQKEQALELLQNPVLEKFLKKEAEQSLKHRSVVKSLSKLPAIVDYLSSITSK